MSCQCAGEKETHGKVKQSSYIAQYPVLRTAQSTLHFTSLADLFNQTPSHATINAQRLLIQMFATGCSQVLIYRA